MATAYRRNEQHQQTPLPPSPPPSPPRTRRRHKKTTSDPFLELAETPLPSPSRPSSPASESGDPPEPFLTRIILTPLLFTSFLLSLFLVNRQDRARRVSPSSRSSILSYLYPTSWLDPEPYQDPADSAWDRRDSAHAKPNEAIAPKPNSEPSSETKKRSSWYLHKKIRKVAKLEISDAFEMRGRVMVLMVAVLAVGVVALCFGLGWVVRSLWR